MNPRVLELLKAPKNIQSEDLNLLKDEINSFPYVQNIRALYLYGVNLYDKDNYQKVLSATAAYTTDKKILYQLINGKIKPKPEPIKPKPDYAENPLKMLYQAKVTNFPIKRNEQNVADDEQTEPVDVSNQQDSAAKREIILPAPLPEIKHLYVNGERNRILFEGEENFLEDDDIETIDLESTLESGSIITQKAEKKEGKTASAVNENITEKTFIDIDNQEITEFTPETIIEEENISETEKEEVLDESEISFHEIEPVGIHNDRVDENNNETLDAESEEVNQTEEVEEFTPETIIEEENISETEKEEVLDESEVSFHKIEPVEIQNDRLEENNDETVAVESEEMNQTEEVEVFTPEKIIEENITPETEKEEILDESEVSFHEVEPVEIQNDRLERNNEDETLNAESEEVIQTEETAAFTPEKIINEDKISSGKEEQSVNDASELSFHGMESFLPEVKIQANNSDEIKDEVAPEPNIYKHEDEMRRLIEEVEKKMREKANSAQNQKAEEPENEGNDISFAETQSFEIKPIETSVKEDVVETPSQSEIVEDQQPIEEVSSLWKPMSLQSNLPDSLIDKSTKSPEPKAEPEDIQEMETKSEEASEEKEILPQVDKLPELVEDHSEEFGKPTDELQIDQEAPVTEEKEDVPVMNVSFFGSDISKLKSLKSQQETEKEEVQEGQETPVEKTALNPADSNVPGFINTWQSWLKIDRTDEVEETAKPVEKEKVELKNKVIETFIETNPRISQLKDEVSFIVKEKNDDISHLMTETLANLYFEQKLYTKAIKAFEILINKTPEKQEYYQTRIQEIKDFRSKGSDK